jgi:hypothetical protein
MLLPDARDAGQKGTRLVSLLVASRPVWQAPLHLCGRDINIPLLVDVPPAEVEGGLPDWPSAANKLDVL